MIIFIEIVGAFVSTFGFAILFNIKGKNSLFAGIGGTLAWFVYKLVLLMGCNNLTSMFISALILSIYAEICARILKTPVTTILACALIPLVPGGGMYDTMYEAIQGNALATWNKALSTMSSAGVLALGILFVSTITRLIKSSKIISRGKLLCKKKISK